MNKHIELVKRWLADPKSVTVEELKANAADAKSAWAASEAAYAAYAAAYAAYAAYTAYAAYAAAKSAADAPYAAALYWVREYERLTDE